jgi:Arc/MetJ-type ribon-helix-helix transcriptional regulator
MDRRVTPWHEQPHSAQLPEVAIPKDVEQQLKRQVGEEFGRRGKYSIAAAVREALALWLSRR